MFKKLGKDIDGIEEPPMNLLDMKNTISNMKNALRWNQQSGISEERNDELEDIDWQRLNLSKMKHRW